jgi:DoxX-like family
MRIYVETRIHAPIEEVWRKTQIPELHKEWDLRFSNIQYLPRNGELQPQRFLYTTRIGFGVMIRGEGESVGSSNAFDGSRTSALKFWSDDPKSLIKDGAGYWQYVPTDNGIRFLTRYDYQVRFGRLGRAFDSVVFRPLIAWATAWSFDRLRLWVEKGIDPKLSLSRGLLHVLVTAVVAFVWIYQGAVPKLIFRHPDELNILLDAGFSSQLAPAVLQLVGWGEVLLGLLVLAFSMSQWPFRLTIVLMLLATVAVGINSPHHLWAAFNPVSLNVMMIALSAVGLAGIPHIPSARRCLRRQSENQP